MSIAYRHLLLVPVFVLASVAMEASVFAQPAGMGRPSGSGAGQQLQAAQANLAYAQGNVDRLKDRAMRALAHDHGWSVAKAAVDEATKNRQQVREQVGQQVMASADYQALQHKLEGTNSPEQQAETQAKMASMVWDAQMQSPECEAANTRLKQAQAELDARWNDYETRVLSRDPDWTAAIAARDAARAQVSAALEAQRATGGTRMSGTGRTGGSYGRSGSSGSRGSSRGTRSY